MAARNLPSLSFLALVCLNAGTAISMPGDDTTVATVSEIAPSGSTEYHLFPSIPLVLDLQDGFPPSNAYAGAGAITVIKIPQAEGGGLWIFDAEQTGYYSIEEQVELVAEPGLGSDTFNLYVDGNNSGLKVAGLPVLLSVTSSSSALGDALMPEISGDTSGTNAPPLLPPVGPDSPLGHKLYDGSRLVVRNGSFVARQKVFDDSIQQFLLSNPEIAESDVTFVDWETGDDAFNGRSSEAKAHAHQGPKRTWRGALSGLKPNGVVVLFGGGPGYESHVSPEEMPSNVFIVCIGEVTFAPPASNLEN